MDDDKSNSSAGYAERLSRGHDRGMLNLAPVLDAPLLVQRKVAHLARLIKEAKYVVLHTGAGLSTAAGVSDFRGPNGIWTTEMRKRMAEKSAAAGAGAGGGSAPTPKRPKYAESDDERNGDEEDVFEMAETPAPDESMQWDEPPTVAPTTLVNAVPTLSHAVIARLVQKNYVQTVVTQNVDNLHQLSGVPRERLAEIHGNLRVEWCHSCQVEYERDYEVLTAGFRPTGHQCMKCGTPLTDKQLDWEDALPAADECRAEEARAKGDLHIVVGSSCQMVPAREYPFRKGRKRISVIVNLSPTPKDNVAGMVIRARCDTVLALLADCLRLEVPEWRHETVVSLRVWRPNDANDNNDDNDGIVAGLHTELGADLNCDAPIPFLRRMRFSADTHVEMQSQTKCIVRGCTQQQQQQIEIRCDAVPANGSKLRLKAVYRGGSVTVCKNVVVRRVEYAEAMQREIDLLKRKTNDRCNWVHIKRQPHAWVVSAERARYSECVLCGTPFYSGSGHWIRKVAQHLPDCLSSIIGKEPKTGSQLADSNTSPR